MASHAGAGYYIAGHLSFGMRHGHLTIGVFCRQVHISLCNVLTALKDIPELNEFVTNSTVSQKDRSAGLDVLYMFARGPPKEPVSEITKTLFVVLSERRRRLGTGHHGGLQRARVAVQGYASPEQHPAEARGLHEAVAGGAD
ncbi:hypothetical protein FOMPIDRAFT_88425 [Fomitopsis schrenkii]|uniref:Uncharacterized protein n=1 Tax=Fomitopsis schrenkii TaxID=2126942 RepID=S8E729_FOMSC|nr:hypothetical protein FOMPIDRAFT_88425 [Fomitopsis schrenkii]